MSEWVFLVECYPDKVACLEIAELALEGFRKMGAGENDLQVDIFKLDHAIF